MHFSTSTALLVLTASVASAAPLGNGTSHHLNSSSTPGQEPFKYPLSNGFPSPDAANLTIIEKTAGGTLSDAPPPPNPGADGITNLQLIAFNELFEVAFFTDLLSNITNHVEGYGAEDGVTDFIIETLIAIQAVSYPTSISTRLN